ncbi:hypothetical protein ACFX2C_026923 [Malus domestica]
MFPPKPPFASIVISWSSANTASLESPCTLRCAASTPAIAASDPSRWSCTKASSAPGHVGNLPRCPESRGELHVALCQESMWSSAAVIHNFGEVVDCLGVKACVEGSDYGGSAVEDELNVGKEMGNGFRLE